MTLHEYLAQVVPWVVLLSPYMLCSAVWVIVEYRRHRARKRVRS